LGDWVIIAWCQVSNLSAILLLEQVCFLFLWDDIDSCFVIDQHADLDFYDHWNKSLHVDMCNNYSITQWNYSKLSDVYSQACLSDHLY
jgi:hypothetical protein